MYIHWQRVRPRAVCLSTQIQAEEEWYKEKDQSGKMMPAPLIFFRKQIRFLSHSYTISKM